MHKVCGTIRSWQTTTGVHRNEDEPKSQFFLRDFAKPIILCVIFVYAAQWAFHFPGTGRINLVAGIIFGGTAALLWILSPRKNR